MGCRHAVANADGNDNLMGGGCETPGTPAAPPPSSVSHRGRRSAARARGSVRRSTGAPPGKPSGRLASRRSTRQPGKASPPSSPRPGGHPARAHSAPPELHAPRHVGNSHRRGTRRGGPRQSRHDAPPGGPRANPPPTPWKPRPARAQPKTKRPTLRPNATRNRRGVPQSRTEQKQTAPTTRGETPVHPGPTSGFPGKRAGPEHQPISKRAQGERARWQARPTCSPDARTEPSQRGVIAARPQPMHPK